MMNFCTLSSYFGVNVQSELEKWVEEASQQKRLRKMGEFSLTQLSFTFKDGQYVWTPG